MVARLLEQGLISSESTQLQISNNHPCSHNAIAEALVNVYTLLNERDVLGGLWRHLVSRC
jgi:hypothetical protein